MFHAYTRYSAWCLSFILVLITLQRDVYFKCQSQMNPLHELISSVIKAAGVTVFLFLLCHSLILPEGSLSPLIVLNVGFVVEQLLQEDN